VHVYTHIHVYILNGHACVYDRVACLPCLFSARLFCELAAQTSRSALFSCFFPVKLTLLLQLCCSLFVRSLAFYLISFLCY